MLRASLTKLVVPFCAFMLVAFAALGYYFWRVTGSPFTTPYQLNMRTYGLVYFPWEKVAVPPQFHHAEMRNVYLYGSDVGWQAFALHHQVKLQALKAVIVWLFYFGPLLTLPWLAWIFHPQAGKIIADVHSKAAAAICSVHYDLLFMHADNLSWPATLCGTSRRRSSTQSRCS